MFTVNSSIRLIAALAVATLCSNVVEARGNPEAGATKAAVCTACHGPNGNSVNPEWPNLAGQSAAYVTEQLTIFRAGHRNNAVMWPMAIALTDEDIADLAAYFSRQTPTGLEADAASYKAGEALYRGIRCG